MQNQNPKFKILSFTLWFCAFSFWLLAFPGPTCVFAEESEIAADLNSVAARVCGDATAQIEGICSAIYEGDFAAARELLGGSTQSKSTAIARLIDIISEYEAIDEKRESARQAAYQKQLARLEKLRAAAAGGVPEQAPSDPNEEKADVNDIPKVLSVIARAVDFANEQQKKRLLSDSLVKQISEKAKSKIGRAHV